MRVDDRVAKCVGFVSRGGQILDYRGTAFLVELRIDETYSLLHLVTAAHVARALEGYGCMIAFNGKDGLPLFANCAEAPWFFHPTEADSVDVAVMPFATPRTTEYDISAIPTEMFVTDENLVADGIGIGDEVFTVGLFTKFFGLKTLIPIVRTGNIAMMPHDRVPLSGFGLAEAYLVEGRSIGGLSGSPVFCRNTFDMPGMTAQGEPIRMSGLGRKRLLGLVHGHWDLPVTFSTSEREEAVNMGISIVIPAKKILETLHHPELVALRNERIKVPPPQ